MVAMSFGEILYSYTIYSDKCGLLVITMAQTCMHLSFFNKLHCMLSKRNISVITC